MSLVALGDLLLEALYNLHEYPIKESGRGKTSNGLNIGHTQSLYTGNPHLTFIYSACFEVTMPLKKNALGTSPWNYDHHNVP